MGKFFTAHAKAVAGFLSAEAATFLVVLGAPRATVKDYVIAVLGPIAVGAAVHGVSNS